MAEEKKEPWLNYLALTTVIFAVCATLSTFKGGSYSTRSVMSQAQAANQWAYYQAKGIKNYLYELQKEKLELELEAANNHPGGMIDAHKNMIDAYTDKIKKYEDEKLAIQNEAKQLEATRDNAQNHAQAFGVAVIFLQVAILLSSISALLKKKVVWYLSTILGTIGIFYFANGFFLFIA